MLINVSAILVTLQLWLKYSQELQDSGASKLEGHTDTSDDHNNAASQVSW